MTPIATLSLLAAWILSPCGSRMTRWPSSAHGPSLTALCSLLIPLSSLVCRLEDPFSRLNTRDDLRAFECVLDVRELERGLIDAGAQNVKAA